MNNLSQEEKFAQLSKGISNNSIYDKVMENLNPLVGKNNLKIIDIGCGEGHFLKGLKSKYPDLPCTGVDLVQYQKEQVFNFVKQDFNKDFEFSKEEYDLTTCIEVIEHIENPRHLLRQLAQITRPGGTIIVTTPNPTSLLSKITFCLKGYHNAFGPKNYPAHITVVSPYHMKHMIEENPHLELQEISFIPNGRIPGTGLRWRNIFPFLKGSLFSDNFMAVIKRK